VTPKETGKDTRRKHAGRGTSERPEVPQRILARGLRAGDMGCALLTVAIAAEENAMPSAEPDEAARILAFLARLAEHDAALPVPPDGSGVGPDRPPPEQIAATLG
jgi:hypothetical protein